MVGAQHALAMVGGLIVPPLLIVPFGTPNGDDYKRYLVQAALIVTGLMTLVQVTGIRIGGKFMWGAGVLSVMGVSFTSVPIVQSTLAKLMKGEGMSFDEAYGHVLGTLCVSTLTPILFSFLPIKVLRKVFPPVVSGVTILLIGIHLTGAGLANWGGGSFCSQTGNYNKLVNGVPAPVLCTGNGQVMYPY
ncbi:uric acid-xanthine permease, partial [Haematococcus lacustris]